MPRKRLPNTPFLDEWREHLELATSPRGAKTDLARFLAHKYDKPISHWQSVICNIFEIDYHLNGEHVLAINEWLRTRNAEPKKKKRAPRNTTDG